MSSSGEVQSVFEGVGQQGGERMALGHRELIGPMFDFSTFGVSELGPSARVLDIGCGVGDALAVLREKKGISSVAGIDLAESMLDHARQKNPGGDFRQGSAQGLPWSDETFDFVFSVESLYYHEDPRATLAEAFRVLKPGGIFASVIEYFAENRGVSTWPKTMGLELHCWSESEWTAALESIGFNPVGSRRVIRQSVKAEDEFRPQPYAPDYETYLKFIEDGALLFWGRK